MLERFTTEVLDRVRSTPLTQAQALEVGLLVVLWAKLSYGERLTPELKVDASLLDKPLDAQSMLAQAILEASPELRESRIVNRVREIDARTLVSVLDLVLRLVDSGLLQEFDPTDAIAGVASSAWTPPAVDNAAMPPELASLLIRLAGLRPSDSVYVGWDQGQVAARAAKQAARVYLETQHSFDFPLLTSLLSERPFEVHHTAPIPSPTAVEGGKIRKFDVAIGTPPLNERFPLDIAEKDWFSRFPERTSSGSVLTTRHLLAHGTRRVVVTVPNSFLFSPGGEESIRRDLVERGIIESVIEMPTGLLYGTNVSFAILVLDPRGGHDHIRFVNAAQDRFREPVSKARAKLVNIDELVSLTEHPSAELSAVGVGTSSISHVLQNEASLAASRHILPEHMQKAWAFFASHREQVCLLGDLVSLIRPMAITSVPNDALEVEEIGAADLPRYGYITKPGRTVLVNEELAEKNEKQFLRPLDIVFIIKGSVGKVGIVPPDVPPPGQGGWVAGQSAVVFRVKANGIDPRELTIQLRSPLFQGLLETFTLRATIPIVQVKNLMQLWVYAGDPSLAGKAAEALEREAAIQRKIDALIEQQSASARDLWRL